VGGSSATATWLQSSPAQGPRSCSASRGARCPGRHGARAAAPMAGRVTRMVIALQDERDRGNRTMLPAGLGERIRSCCSSAVSRGSVGSQPPAPVSQGHRRGISAAMATPTDVAEKRETASSSQPGLDPKPRDVFTFGEPSRIPLPDQTDPPVGGDGVVRWPRPFLFDPFDAHQDRRSRARGDGGRARCAPGDRRTGPVGVPGGIRLTLRC
jgi:hypothetical protein